MQQLGYLDSARPPKSEGDAIDGEIIETLENNGKSLLKIDKIEFILTDGDASTNARPTTTVEIDESFDQFINIVQIEKVQVEAMKQLPPDHFYIQHFSSCNKRSSLKKLRFVLTLRIKHHRCFLKDTLLVSPMIQ